MNTSPDSYNVAADELRHIIETYERLESEKAEISNFQAVIMKDAKALGYDTKIIRKIIALRKRKPDEIAEQETLLDMYKSALGMQ